MTKEQIIAGLQNAAKPYEEYYIEDDLMGSLHCLRVTVIWSI